MLVDTGSNVTIIKKGLLDTWPDSQIPEIRPVNMGLVTATGEISPFLGKIDVNLTLGSQTFNHDVLLADIQNDGIIGIDFLNKCKCDIMVSKKCLKLNGEKIHCFMKDGNKNATTCRIAVTENVVIPPESEIIIPGKPVDIIQSTVGLIEPNPKFTQKTGLMVGKTLVDVNKGELPIRMANLSKEPYTLYRNTIAATYETVTIPEIKNVETISTNDQHNFDYSSTEVPPHLTDMYEKATKHLSAKQRDEVRELLLKHSNLFSKSDDDLGRTHLVEHTIDTGTSKPIKQAPYRVPLAKRLIAEQEIKNMAEKGIIEPSNSPWSNPVVMVTKPDGSIRFCCDLRKVNDCTIKDSQPLPRIDDTLDALSGSKWYTTLDLVSGYWQIGLAEKDRPKTAFAIQGSSLWQYTVMPFGACNAPATFERLMERVLSGLTWNICLVYLDDIIVTGKTFHEHLANLNQIFDRLTEANLKLSPRKCNLLQKEVCFLGHNVNEHGISTDQRKISAVENWPLPQNVKQIRSFLGLCSYYRRFVHNFSTIAKPLHKLTEKGANFVWTDECQYAFETLKRSLVNAPILAYPSPTSGQFILDADASNVALGAVLSQIQNGEEKVIAYYSRCFSKPERHYCVTRRELLAVIDSIKNFHHYLYGAHFMVRSDHGALRWLMNFKKPEGQIARWIEILATYDYEIQHRAGRIHSNADALSRRPCISKNCSYCERAETKYCEVQCISNSVNTTTDHTDDKLTKAVFICDASVPTKTTNYHDSDGESSYLVAGRQEACTDGKVIVSAGIKVCDDSARMTPSNSSMNQGAYSSSDLISSQQHDCLTTSCNLTENKTVRSCDEGVHHDLKSFDRQKIISSQDEDPIISTIKQWKLNDEKPEWREVASQSVELKYYWNRLDSLVIKDDILYRKWENFNGKLIDWHIVVPKSLRPTVLRELHDSPTGGHFGVKKTLYKVQQRFFWYQMRQDVEHWCNVCDICAARKMPIKKPRSAMKQYNVGAPLERVGIDIMGPFPCSKQGNKYILMIADYFTKWLVAIPIKNQEATTVADKFIERFVSVFGVPLQIHSDQGRNFESLVFKEMCRILGSEKTRTTPMRPQSDGLVERANRTLQNMLSAFVSENQDNWDEYLHILTVAYNTAKHESTGFSPSMMMYGRDINVPIDLIRGKPDDDCITSQSNYGQVLDQTIQTIHEMARKNLYIASSTQKKRYDHRINQNKFSEGSLVWLHNPQIKLGRSAKLSRPWFGPYTVIKRLNDVIYKIQLTSRSKPKIVHHDRLKTYNGTQTSWLKTTPET